MSTYQLSKTSATFLTFLLSALCHEMVMAVVTKKIRQVKRLMRLRSTRLNSHFSHLYVLRLYLFAMQVSRRIKRRFSSAY